MFILRWSICMSFTFPRRELGPNGLDRTLRDLSSDCEALFGVYERWAGIPSLAPCSRFSDGSATHGPLAARDRPPITRLVSRGCAMVPHVRANALNRDWRLILPGCPGDEVDSGPDWRPSDSDGADPHGSQRLAFVSNAESPDGRTELMEVGERVSPISGPNR